MLKQESTTLFRSKSIGLRRILHRVITYPMLMPVILTYLLTKDPGMLDLLYFIRSIPHGIPLRNSLRLARYEGNWLLFPTREDPNLDDVFLRNVYYPYEPRQDDTVVDIGAHMGFFTVKVAKHVKKVIAFEPDPYNFSFLLKNIQINKLSNVKAFNYAFGKEKTICFLRRSYGYGRTRLTETNTGCKIMVNSLDAAVEEENITPNVIKIDTEGYEMQVLEGAKSTITRHRPRLIIASYHYPNEAREVVKYLGGMGFRSLIYYVPLALQRTKETYIFAKPI